MIAKKSANTNSDNQGKLIPENLIKFDTYGLFSFSIAIITGLLIGQIKIPLPGGGSFSLGTSGGPLLTGIIIGHFKNISIFDMRVKIVH